MTSPPLTRALFGAAAVLAILTSTTACSSSSDKTKLTIFAASSLTSTFTTLESQFESDHPDLDVVLSFGSSTTLAEQIAAGAPADVIATADETSMSVVSDADQLATAATPFATNSLVIAVPPGNPGNVSGVDSLTSTDFVMCAVSAPCGAAGAQMLENAGVTAQPKSFEPDVASVLTKVELKEADAGIVYVTDAISAGDKVDTAPIPEADNVINSYYIAPVKGAAEASLATAWVTLVTSAAGQRVLVEAGFHGP